MKHQQLLLLFFAALVTGACIWFLTSPAVIGAMCGAFLAAASAYTALDLRAVVKSTSFMPASDMYQKADKWKYFIAMVLTGILFLICIIRQIISGINLELSIGILGPGILGLIAIILGGMKLNKAAMLKDPSQ